MNITREMIESGATFHCNTEEHENELLKKLDELGYKSAIGASYLDKNSRYGKDGSTCYCPVYGTWSCIEHCREGGYIIIEYVLDKYSKEFTMDDIKDGYLVELRNGDKYLCCNDSNNEKILINDEQRFIYCRGYSNFNLNLMILHSSDYDIFKVYGRNTDPIYLLSFKITDDRNLLWKREETTEMTIEELCKIAGRDIKIVK